MGKLLLLLLLRTMTASAELPPDPIDFEIEKVKPRPEDSLKVATEKCELLAATSPNTSLLLIGIEGQGGFKVKNAWLVYRYLWRLRKGIPDSPPLLDTSAPVLHRLMLPLIDHFSAQIELLNFPETFVRGKFGGVPEACAVAWMKKRGRPRVMLLGHSFGADAIHDLSLILENRGIQVDQAYSMDAVAKSPAKRFRKPTNVRLWMNFLQRNETPFGSVFVGAERNFDLSSLGVNHRTIVRSSPVLSTIKANNPLTYQWAPY